MNTIVHKRRFPLHRMLLAGIAICLPLAAQAGEPAGGNLITSSLAVSYSDLDLSDPAGARTLYARLKRASAEVCGHQPSPLEPSAWKEYQDCYNLALNIAVERVNSQQLYALHGGRRRQTTAG